MKNRFKRAVLFLLGLVLEAGLAHDLLCAQMSLSSISPKGRQVYEEEKRKYPDFDKAKYEKEAEAKYPLVKVGEQITIVTRRSTYAGKFGGMKGSSILVADKVLPTVDIPPEDILKYSPVENAKVRNAFITKFSNEYNARKLEFMENLKEEIFLKYPALDEKRLDALLAKIADPAKKIQYADFIRSNYEDGLPLSASLADLEKSLSDKLLGQCPELCFADGVFWNRQEKEELEKRARKMAKERLDRMAARVLAPRTSAPIFEPDGGIFEPGKDLKISCATEGASIHYTLDGSEPNETSPRYEGPIAMNRPLPVKAVAFHPEFNDSDVSLAAPWAGGVFTSCFETMTFRGRTVERVDAEIDFKSGGKSPAEGIIPDHLFSVVWAGQIIPDKSGEYEFFLTADDGARMWLGDVMLIDAWKEQAPTEYSKKIKLDGGRKYDFKIAFTEVMGFAQCRLEWQTGSDSRQVIPQERLFPEGKYVDELKKWNKKIVGGSEETYPNRQGMKNPGEYAGDFKLPVRGGQKRWDQLGIK